jgi:hypothetical protein
LAKILAQTLYVCNPLLGGATFAQSDFAAPALFNRINRKIESIAMFPKPFLLLGALCLAPFLAAAQQNAPKTKHAKQPAAAADSLLHESRVILFRQVGVTDTSRTVLHVRTAESGEEAAPIQGATVLLRRDKDKMLGRVTKGDGKCSFVAAPAEYTVRVQMTGLRSLEKTGILLEAGKAYEMDIRMVRNN